MSYLDDLYNKKQSEPDIDDLIATQIMMLTLACAKEEAEKKKEQEKQKEQQQKAKDLVKEKPKPVYTGITAEVPRAGHAEARAVKDDPVAHPAHYTSGKIEVMDFIDDQKLSFARGNIVKYVCRAGKKENELEDLKKAKWYLDHEIALLENGKAAK